MRLFSYAAMILTAAAIATPAVAEDELDVCNIDQADIERQVFKHLVGNWTVKNGAGHAVMSGGGVSMPIPMEPEPDESLDFIMDGDQKLRAVNWADMSSKEIDFTVLIGETILDEALKAIPTSGVSEEDLATTVGCDDPDTMPKLHAEGIVTDGKGKMTWVANFVVLSDKLIHGAMSFSLKGAAGIITGYRIISLTR